jgi:hypothetical protein
MKIYHIVALIFTLAFLSLVSAQEGEMILVKDSDYIKVYKIENAWGNLNRIIARSTFNSNYMNLFCLIKDHDNHKNWIYANKGGYILDSISPWQRVYYAVSETPVLLADRDFVTDVDLTVDLKSKSLLIHSVGNQKYKPDVPDLVRIQMIDSHWTLRKIDEIHTEAELNLLIDVGGSLPDGWSICLLPTTPSIALKT